MRVQNSMQGEGRGWKEIEEEMKARQRREGWRKVVESRYNSWYRVVKEEGKPENPKKLKKESKWNRMVRYIMGEGVRKCRDWMGKEEIVCRVCRFERESWAQVLEKCTGDKGGGAVGGWESEMDFEWMWSGAGMDEDAGRGERKSRMHGEGESLKTSSRGKSSLCLYLLFLHFLQVDQVRSYRTWLPWTCIVRTLLFKLVLFWLNF